MLFRAQFHTFWTAKYLEFLSTSRTALGEMLLALLIDGEAEARADAILCPLNQCGAQVPCLKHALALGFHCAFLQEA